MFKKFILLYMRIVPFICLVLFFATTIGLFVFAHEYFLILACVITAYQVFIVMRVGYYGAIGYNYIFRDEKIEWKEKYEREKKFDSLEWDDVVMYIIIPNYKEDIHVLEEMIENLARSPEAQGNIIPVLAMEAREEGHAEKAQKFIDKYKDTFKDFIFTAHPPGIKDEVPGKSSNENWACRDLEKHIKGNNFNENNVLVCITDADSLVHPKFFSAVIQKFCCSPKRHRITWQPPIVNFLNLHKINVFSRIMSYVVTTEVIANLTCPFDEGVPFSTYALSFKSIKEVDFFDPKIIAEDEHMYMRCCFEFGDEYDCKPVYLPNLCYSVGESDKYWDGVNERWKQAKRHMIAIHEVVYMLRETYNFIFYDKSRRKLSLVKWCTLFHRIAYPHAFAVAGVWMGFFTTFLYPIMMFIWEDWKTYLWDSYWYIALQILLFLTGMGMAISMWTSARLWCDLEMNSKKGFLFKVYSYAKMMIEMALFGAISLVGFTFVPALINFYKLLYKEKFEYEVATKTKEVVLEGVKVENSSK